jgi:MoaA/NifB/PqqE/SkfB family radical SAM enzyme
VKDVTLKPKNYVFDGHKLHYHPDRLCTFLQEGDCFPLYIEVSPAGRCNHRCIFCAYDYLGHPDRRLETERFLRFIDELSACGARSVLLAGEGEPLLHPDIDLVILHTRQKGIDVGVFTNGHLLHPDRAERILPALTFVRFSFNGGSDENYAHMHGVRTGTYEKVARNLAGAASIKTARGLSVDIGAQFVLLSENLPFLQTAVKRIKEAGADYFVIKPFVQQSGLQRYQMKEQFRLEAIEGALSAAESLSDDRFKVIARRESFSSYGKRGYRHCYGTSFISVLNSAGDIASCLPYWERTEFVFGNIYESSFADIWQGPVRMKVKAFLERELDVTACPPNCRPNAINEYLSELKHPKVQHINFI